MRHGIFIEEQGTALSAPVEGYSSVPVVVGTAPVNMAADPAATVNVPILATSATEAMAALGYSRDMANYTLCQMMYLTANVFVVSPVVYINVLDPAKHKKALSEDTYQVNQGQAIIKKEGILLAGLVVKKAGSTTLTKETDYTAEFNTDGHLVITLIDGGQGEGATSLTVSGNILDPSMVTAADIVGAYDARTGKETGLQLLRQVYPKLQIVPGTIAAPGWSQIPEVGIAMQAKAANLNGCFKSMALVDLDTKEGKAVKYTDCKTVKEESGFTSAYGYPLWPCDRYGEIIVAKSATVAALVAYQAAGNDDVPSLYPSNKMLGCTGQCLADGTEVVIDKEQAETVNGYGVTTAINMGGWRLFGNYTGAYPASTDAKDIFFAVRRMFNWHGNTFIQTYFEKVDDPMNSVLIESVVDSENIRAAAYAPDKWAGASMEYRAEDNPATDILAGKMTFRQHIAPYTPAQEIVNKIDYDISMLQTALTAGGE